MLTPSVIESQKRTVGSLTESLSSAESFVFLSGQAGSGRTAILEQTVRGLESRFLTVFIPCEAQMTLETLRELFYSQLLAGREYDVRRNIPDSLLKSSGVPVKQKVLIVIDDIDTVVQSFYNEILTLFEQSRGKGQFSVLLSARPLYAQAAIARSSLSRVAIDEVEVRPLDLSETLEFARQLFVSRGLLTTYKVLKDRLPAYYERSKGNLGNIIKLTEALMDNPEQVKNSEAKPLKKSRRGLATTFIGVVCLLIVLACLVPLFLGSDIFSKLTGGEAAPDPESVASVSAVGGGDGPEAAAGEGAELTVPQVEPLEVVESREPDIRASSEHGSAESAVEDQGELLPAVADGLEVQSPEATTRNSVVLRGDTLNEIENSRAGSNESDRPRPGLDGSVASPRPENPGTGDSLSAEEGTAADRTGEEPSEAAEPRVLARENNALKAEEIAREDAELARRAAEERARRLAELAEAERQRKEQELKAELDRRTAVLTAAPEPKPQAKKRSLRKDIPFSGKAIPGAESELLDKDPRHFTLQVVSGHDRDAVISYSQALEGRYWVYTTTRNSRPWHVLCTGDYETANAAFRDGRRLPKAITDGSPFAKSFADVQREIGRR